MIETKNNYMVCSRGLWDTSVPGIAFDEKGVSNYARMFDALCENYPRGEIGKRNWDDRVMLIKKLGRGKKYDCIIGVSGGTDSSYLLYVAKEIHGLRPLAVNLDNGWSSDVAVQNIKRVTKALNIDLITYVINYEEVKAVLRAYLKAGLPWVDAPTDHAINAALVRTARREGIKSILNGSDFRSEGKQPTEWTYGDARQLIYIANKFENLKLDTYPTQKLIDLIISAGIKKIKTYRPFNSIDYKKSKAQEFLINEFDWKYYGGHHHENIFTRFVIAYWLPRKFNIDKRIITLSAQVLSGEIERNDALEMIKKPPYDPVQIERDKEYVLKKLDFTNPQFLEILKYKNKFYWDYPSYAPLIEKYSRRVKPLIKYIYPAAPTIFVEKQFREKL